MRMAMHMLWLTVPALLLSVALVRQQLVWIWQWCHLAKMGSDSGKITIREGFAIEWTLTQVNITSLSTLPCSIAEGVQESVAKNGSENPLADCVSLAPPCKIGAKAIGADVMVVLKATCDVGRTTFQEAVVAEVVDQSRCHDFRYANFLNCGGCD